MGKYIIELEDKPFHKEDGDFLYRAKGFNSLVFDMTGIGKLTPYTEPGLEQVRKEAYKDGYDAGFGRKIDVSYQEGLADAWEAAKKIARMDTETSENVTGYFGLFRIMNNLTAAEAIEKVKAYEQKQEEIKVGDEVLAPFGTAVVTSIVDDKIWFCYADGHCGFDYKKDKPRKTGRHFHEIATVLDKMRENT